MQIFTTYLATPLGEMFAAANENHLLYLQFYDEDKIIRQFPYYVRNNKPNFQATENQVLNELKIQCKEYFELKRVSFNIATEYFGTRFQQKVWNHLADIPHGSTLSYAAFAKKMGEEGKARAVAYAISRNPILIVNPCHRVISSTGNLTGYAGKIWRKKSLLDLELRSTQKSLF